MNNKKQRNRLFTMLLLVMVILMPYGGAWAQTPPSKGDGSADKPYKISTAAELAWFRDQVNSGNNRVSATLTEDIDLAEFCHAADGTTYTDELSWTPITWFQGTFDGNGKTISNLYINATSNYTGFFGYAYVGSIKNITFDNARVKNTGGYNFGILVGNAGSCIIENIKTLANCSVEGENYVGGIAGVANGNISNCENRATVKGIRYLGGVVAAYSGNSITSCANYGVVTGSGESVGGIAGYFNSGTIQNSANYGDITGKDNVGNLIGEGIICNLNNVLGTGNVTATSDTERAGLLVGRISKSSSAASGILAYNSSAKLTINGAEQTGEAVKAIGEGSLTYPEGVNEADVIKAFTAEQLKSGEVAYLLAEGKVLGEQAWGQQLGKDQYPVPGSDYKVIRAAQGDKDTNGNDTYWATFSNPTNDVTLSVPSDRSLNVYNATVSGGKLTLTQRDKQVAKEEGVLLKTDGAYVNAKANETNDLTKVSSDVNHLVATPAEAKTVTAETGCKLYRLTYNKATAKERLGFYLSNDGISLKATPGKAYLQVSENEAKDPSSAALARSFVFGGGNETTGIDGITIMGTDVQRHGTIEGIFDLQGRKIVNPTKGIYIKNNKKVVIK
ncbi:hypothetical protein F7D91_12870 [Prevotella copri]|uniref:hypothetical protein n=1 Tax=Segatella copri TaxID=165179 RepID=UPI001292727D|nr:hypothetical protein [Segatella copri]MQM91389.1 hypothetical protein [Segatella copri]